MMENYINNLNLSDSGNLIEDHTRWNEDGTAILSSEAVHNNLWNVVGPAYTGCNLDIARNLSEKDLRALDYDIPDEYLHQCLANDDLLSQNSPFSIVSDTQDTLRIKENESLPDQINTSSQALKKSFPGVLHFGPFLVDDFQNPTGKIQEAVGYKLMEQEFMPSKINAEQELLSQPFRINYLPQKFAPLIEIDNFVNEIKHTSKAVDTSIIPRCFTKVCSKTKEPNFLKIKSGNRSDQKVRLLKKKRKPRTTLTANQLLLLNKAFAKNNYLTFEMAKLLSNKLDMSETCLKTWFQNQRARFKRMNLSYRDNTNGFKGSGSFQLLSITQHNVNMDRQNKRNKNNSCYGKQQKSYEGNQRNSYDESQQNSSDGSQQNSCDGNLQNSCDGNLQNSCDGNFQNSCDGNFQNSCDGNLQNSNDGNLQNPNDGNLQNPNDGNLQNPNDGYLQNYDENQQNSYYVNQQNSYDGNQQENSSSVFINDGLLKRYLLS